MFLVNNKKIPLIIIICFIGVAYCLFFQWGGASLLCLTDGCKIYSQMTLGGVSFYTYGMVFFCLLGLMAWFGRSPDQERIRQGFGGLLSAGVLINAGLLLYQFFFVLCVSCLVVAALIGMILFLHPRGKSSFWRAAWLVCFLVALLSLTKAELMGPQPAYGSQEAPIKVFFSPSCRSCRELLGDILKQKVLFSQTALFPVAKNEKDLQKLAVLLELLKKGVDLSVALDLSDKPSKPQSYLGVQWMSWRNKSFLIRNGYSQVPVLITTKGDILKEEKQDAWDLFKKNSIGGCGFAEEKECD